MSGVSDPNYISLAERLRRQANEFNDRHDAAKVDKLYKEIMSTAQNIAQSGSFKFRFFNSLLDDDKTVKALQKTLILDGFNVSDVHEDPSYSEHAKQRMIYIEISW